jgi:SAM-dependent methyltransferase
VSDPEPEWRRLNRANWDERVPIHLASSTHYGMERLTRRPPAIDPIAADALGPVDGLEILHLQCHFGMDTLNLAKMGASVTGVDFSAPAIEAARRLAGEIGMADRARFVLSDVYEAPAALPRSASFDRVFVSWGTLCWLPDVRAWARVVAHFLRPGGWLGFADAHPFMYVYDSATKAADGMPGWYVPYLGREPSRMDTPGTYADPAVWMTNTETVEFLHPVSDIVAGLEDAGLRVERFREHDSIVWKSFDILVEAERFGYRWPDRPWLPLSMSLRAVKD